MATSDLRHDLEKGTFSADEDGERKICQVRAFCSETKGFVSFFCFFLLSQQQKKKKKNKKRTFFSTGVSIFFLNSNSEGCKTGDIKRA